MKTISTFAAAAALLFAAGCSPPPAGNPRDPHSGFVSGGPVAEELREILDQRETLIAESDNDSAIARMERQQELDRERLVELTD